MGKKKKKEKVTYIDDNSTVADMSITRKGGKDLPPKRESTFKEKMKTFFSVMKKMVLPMVVTLFVFTLIFFVFMLLAR